MINNINSLLWLATHEIVFFSTYNENTKQYEKDNWFAYINTSDVFMYACVDGVFLPVNQAPYVKNLYHLFDFDGIVAWASLQREEEPLKAYLKEKYYEAKEYIIQNPFQPTEEKDLNQLVKEFFYYLDIVEESDSGYAFHPNKISSCRAIDGEKMGILLQQIKQRLI